MVKVVPNWLKPCGTIWNNLDPFLNYIKKLITKNMMLEKINIKEKFTLFSEYWTPNIIAKLNGQAVKIAKIKGPFIWHHHENEDELFLVIKGQLKMEFRDKTEILNEGDIIVVPKGVEHRPVAEEECHILMFEPESTLNTGNVENDRTVEAVEL